ncbi:coiled-coil membrane protein [Scheffersomyces amazonensis]|uniref:coiled-coil membrane protein n=1 Tax=Scheffersomyces amazonensis TaxID=1078765 RepID=UPI00315CE661
MLDWIDLHPYTLLIITFIILVSQEIIGFIGKNQLQEFVWLVYVKVGTQLSLSDSFKLYSTKVSEIQRLNKEKRLISAQDEYAKWTKLNRQVDKLTGEIAQLKDELSKNKSSINSLVNLFITLLTTVPLWFFRVWFRKSALFYLPPHYLPHTLEWILAIPFFPVGTIGLTVWIFAVKQVISSLVFLLTFPFEQPTSKPVKVEKVVEVKN